MKFPYTTEALRVVQPLGIYYVAAIPAGVLLDTCFSDRLRAIPSSDGSGYELIGTQRGIDKGRLRVIGEYIARYDAAFPNSIILATNFRDSDGTIEEDSDLRWTVSKNDAGQHTLTIPSEEKLAAIIDGQHRLFAFKYAGADRLDMQLVCAVFVDLPKPFQAQLFATINSTQKPVDKSLTYQLFGYNISEESEEYWSPDKLAVFLARKLNADPGSPLHNRIIIAAEDDALRDAYDVRPPTWQVSMATIVEGILRLFSTNPKRDTAELLTPKPNLRSALIGSSRDDRSPLRGAYLEGNDQVIYVAVSNYLAAVDEVFWRRASVGSFIKKTVGIQAMFDILKGLVPEALQLKDLSVQYFADRLAPAARIDFDSDAFRNASGSGRIRIRKAIESSMAAGSPAPS